MQPSRSFPCLVAALIAVLAIGHHEFADAKPKQPQTGVQVTKLGTFAANVFDQGGAEIAAFDPGSDRLFVVNGTAAAPRVDVLSIKNPSVPKFLFSIDVTPYGASAQSVAVGRKSVAVAIQAAVKTDPGKVVFFDMKGRFISEVTVGALPDMLTFTPDGDLLLVANEGEPSDDLTVDPEGSISIIDVSKGPKKVTQADVTQVGFGAFNGTTLEAGARIGRPGATAAQDFEPEYITVSPDSTKAWVTLQESNAIAIVDLVTKTVTSVEGLGFKDYGRVTAQTALAPFPAMPVLGTTADGQQILLGGFSGLHFEGIDSATGRLKFLTHPDRGPNGEPKDTDGDTIRERPFALPSFQPELVRFEVDPATRAVTLGQRIPLKRTDGSAMTGLPNRTGANNAAFADEIPIDLRGSVLARDPLGADFEGVVTAPDGTFWMVEEYRPSIYHFDATGLLLARYVPTGSNAGGVTTGIEALPAELGQRRANRGFEAVALFGTKLYAFVQSPIDNPDTASDANSKAGYVCRIVEFDTVTLATTAQYAYVLEGRDGAGPDKIGDAVAVGAGEFLVVERDDLTGAAAQKKVWRVSLGGATNLQTLAAGIVGPGGTLDTTLPANLAAIGVKPVRKDLYVDLVTAGYDAFDKVEGLCVIDRNRIAVINDNDFNLAGTFDQTTGRLDFRATPVAPTLGIITVSGTGLDASDRDTKINIRNWPVRGMYQPDAIASSTTDDGTFLFTANEGDTRAWTGFNEEKRVKDVTLDPAAFKDPATLRLDQQLGRLVITSTLGDTDNDGDFDQLYTFGARSMSVWSATGDLVWDSGDEIERVTASAFPGQFNSDHATNASFDTRSDNKGPEPEGVTVGKVGDRTYAFLGLERIGGFMIYDVTDPRTPVFVKYVNDRDFAGDTAAGAAGDLGPEGMLFIPANQSPVKKPLLVVANEISGTTSIWRLDVERAEKNK